MLVNTGQLTDNLITNDTIVGRTETSVYHERIVYTNFKQYAGDAITPISVVIKLQDEEKTEVTIAQDWVNFTFGKTGEEQLAFAVRARLRSSSFEIQGVGRHSGVINEVYKFNMKSLTTQEKTYEQFYYKQ